MADRSELLSQIEARLAEQRQQLDQALEDIRSLQGADPKPEDLTRVQMTLQQMTMQADLTSKVVTRSEKSIDDLLKGA